MKSYFASMGFIGIPGTIDRVDVENSMSLSMREGTTTSCLKTNNLLKLMSLFEKFGNYTE